MAELMGKGEGTNAKRGALWHAKHLKHLLLTMLEDQHLERQDLLRRDEIAEVIKGYDPPLPPDAERRIAREFMPWLRQQYPELEAAVVPWLE